jgi:hypothetical protein
MEGYERLWMSELPEEIVPIDDLTAPGEDVPDLRSERVQIEEPDPGAAPIEEPAG